MTGYDDRARAQAARQLALKPNGKGQKITLHAPGTAGAYDPNTDTTSGGSNPIDHTGSGVEESYSAQMVASGAVQANDVKFLLSPLETNGQDMPLPVADSWSATMADGSKRAIKRVEALRPAGKVVMYTLQLRGP